MKAERILTAVILVALVACTLAVLTGVLRFGPLASVAIQVGAGLDVPPLDDAAMIRRGAAHYDIVCATCHASPLSPDRADHLILNPPAPVLHTRSGDWLPEVVFLTVKHGIPDSAMPAWPAPDRDDEVWSLVAFLRVLPELEVAEYRTLAGLDIEADAAVENLETCARCHGANGQGDPTGAFPRIDIQTAEYIEQTLRAYREGTRQSGFMAGIAAQLSEAERTALASHFATMRPLDLRDAPFIVTAGNPGRHVPACITCHGPPEPARAEVPRLAGQYPDYLALQLRLFAEEPFTRGGGPFVGLMREAGHGLTEADIEAVARWYGRTE